MIAMFVAIGAPTLACVIALAIWEEKHWVEPIPIREEEG